ncbi:hypothetical protein CAPTEDRAFT_161319 [Capitella teleta]|uniref:MPN domain-containing protein n=1 Tax=Capitella teleta TaxID=283909 RepID=R7T857_CAPTE|nr:hypothetical protein CAPTEDRAFT_161319 [Capitella teleta]|eukprot:ELT87605.1 hypothetical protein CAPTEDRAFT_161319 [Capitella teleta]
MSVRISSPVLSSLFCEHNNSNNDQEGFLLGTVANHITDTISDSQITNIKEETVTYIHSYVPCSSPGSFYESCGKVCHDALQAVLSDGKHRDVIGWYKLRRNTSMKVSFRENLVHGHLSSCFPRLSNGQFLFLLGTSSAVSNKATHSYEHTFLSCRDRVFQGLPLTVVNLGDTDSSEYKHQLCHTVRQDHGIFASMLQENSSKFFDSNGVMQSVSAILDLNTQLNQQLKNICAQVSRSEQEVAQITAEVNALQEKLDAARMDQSCEAPPLIPTLPNPILLDNEVPDFSLSTGGEYEPEPSAAATELIQVDFSNETLVEESLIEPKNAQVEQKESKNKDHFSFIGDLLRGGIKDITLKDFVNKTSKSFDEPFSEKQASATRQKSVSAESRLHASGETPASSQESSDGQMLDSTLSSSPTF